MTTHDEQLIIAFYEHADNNQLPIENVVDILLSAKMSELIDIVTKNSQDKELKPFDIPQFSNINDSFDSVPTILENFSQEKIGFSQMGYYLRNGKTKKEGADKKYGENHVKTATLLKLCNLSKEKPTTVRLTELGHLYVNLPKEIQDRLRPRLCLYLFMVQQYFKARDNYISKDECLLSLMSFLSDSTKHRRLSNCRLLIDIIEKELINEL